MKQIRIHDITFAHDKGSSAGNPPKYFEWIRTGDYEIEFFTDFCLSEVDASKATVKVAWLVEPPCINYQSYKWMIANHKKFDYVLTHNKNLCDGKRWLWAPMGSIWIKPEDCKLHEKCILLPSIIASGKKQAPGHRLRHEVIAKYSDKMNVFGRGYSPLEYKLGGLASYYYSFAIMNCRINGYFTDILLDCFATGTVPLWWGAKDIGQYFNIDGMIVFNTIEELETILPTLTKELYDSKLPAIQENLKRSEQYRVAEDWIWENYPFLFKEMT